MEEEYHLYSSHPMGNASRIMRRSIFTFLKAYHFFSFIPSLLLLPFTFATLLSSSFISSSYLFPLVSSRLRSLFLAAGLPPSSELFIVLNFKLSQTILSSLFVSPFALSFLLLAKGSIVRALDHQQTPQKHSLFSWFVTFRLLFITHLCNSLLIVSTNATCLVLLVILFNFSDILGFSSPKPHLFISAMGAIVYSIILANVCVICSMSLIVSALERHGGFISILRACVLIRGRTATALSLAVPINMAMAGVDALFQYRVVRAYQRTMDAYSTVVLEAMLVAYLYALLVVIDTIVGYVFLTRCRPNHQNHQEEIYCHKIEIQETEYGKAF